MRTLEGPLHMTDAQFWDRIAEKYAKSPISNMDAYEYTLERTRSYLGSDDTVLEVGCGTGTTALALAPSAGHIVASDLSSAMITVGQQKATDAAIENVSFAVAGVEALPEGAFDVVMSFNLLHLLRDLDGGLEQIAGRVRPGGVFISKTICMKGPGVPLWMRALLLALPLMQLIGKAPFVAKFSVGELEDAIIRAGFEIVETGSYPDRPARRFIVARKPG